MKRHKDLLAVVLAVAAVCGIGGLVVATVLNAQNAGRHRLGQVQVAQVQELARSMDTRAQQAFDAFAGVLSTPYHVTAKDGQDAARLQALQALNPKATTGYVLVNKDGVVVNGTLLRDPASIGQKLDRPGLATVLAGKAAFLPVAPGITTTLPTIALAYPLKSASGALNGAFVYESEVSPTSQFNAEVATLAGSGHAKFSFVDGNGVVLASNNSVAIGHKLSEPLLGTRTGLLRGNGEVVVVEAVPNAGWRAVFQQPVRNFEGSLTSPLHSALIYVALLTIIIAGLLAVVLLRRLARSREEQRRLAQLSADREEFISIVSHELRTPVSGLMGFLQTALDHWDGMEDSERRRAVARAYANASRLYSLSRDVLDSSSVESGQLSYTKDLFDLREVVLTAVTAAQDLHPDNIVNYESTERPLWVTGDPERLQQVVNNLLDNALKSTPPDGPVVVDLTAEDDTAVITVRDSGPGLSGEDLDRAFDKFVRGRGRRTVGTGLGLYISRRIVEAHNGTITAGNAPSGGAVFRVELGMTSSPAEPVGA
ncbi:MAG: ATP-binding protein [Actinomycetes bacterium]